MRKLAPRCALRFRLRGPAGGSDTDIAAVKEAGYSEAQIVEIVALVVENVFTNFLNRVAQTDIDFPVLHIGKAA
jgi:alkylhydroperoxidase family enzyme